MGITVSKVINIALSLIGYTEKATNSQLDDFYANAGSNNYQKYGRDLFNAGYYNGNKNGYEWCDLWVDWVFWMSADKNRVVAETATCQYGTVGGAGCTNSRAYYLSKGRLFKSPKVGDLAFFSETQKSDPENADHTGIVIEVNLPTVKIAEGNKSNKVCLSTYYLNDGWLYDFGRPYYDDINELNDNKLDYSNNVNKNDKITYTVKSGDTLSLIALDYNLTVELIAKYNNIKDVNSLFIGLILKLYEDEESKVIISIDNKYLQTTESLPKTIWDFLFKWLNNEFGVAGLIGNLYAESGLVPNNLQDGYEKSLGYTDKSYTDAVDNKKYDNFVNDAAGYGLALWTYYTRKLALYNYAKSINGSIGNITVQLEFLKKELSESYSGLVQTLKLSKSVYDASTAVLTVYERPADQSNSVKQKRAAYGEDYYNKYSLNKNNIKEDDAKNDSQIITVNYIKEALKFYNNYINSNLDVDGEWGPLTNMAATKSLLKAVNTDVDGEIGPNTIACINRNYVKFGSSGNIVSVILATLSKYNYNLKIDGFAGNSTISAIKDFLIKNGLEVDGIAGSETWLKLLS